MEKPPAFSYQRRSPRPPTDRRKGRDWRQGLPLLRGSSFVLREVEGGDARSLLAAISTDQVTRFIPPPPPTVGGFRNVIARAVDLRKAGTLVCFAVVPEATGRAIGLFQVRALSPTFNDAEWGFAFAAEYWGGQVFGEAARLVIGFSFSILAVHRLEARVAVRNGRGNGALRKLGAVQEGLLRRAFFRNGEYLDQVLWTIVAEDWETERARSNLRMN